MIKIDIISGFLGAGKTTLIKKLIKEAMQNERIVLIENEFGEIGVDGGFLKEAGIEIKEMNSGCICCSLVGDFGVSLKEVIEKYQPERIIIEPSGVGKLSDVMQAVEQVIEEDKVVLNSAVAVVDAMKCKMYIKNFGEFFINQISHAGAIILSRTGQMKEEKVAACMELTRKYNPDAPIVTTPWLEISGVTILDTMEQAEDMANSILKEMQPDHNHHHHADCDCGCHEGHHQDEHHHAEQVFTSWGIETPKGYRHEEIAEILEQLENEKQYGMVLRAKGMLPSSKGKWIYFDYVPGECDIRSGTPDITGKICVIGANINEKELSILFGA